MVNLRTTIADESLARTMIECFQSAPLAMLLRFVFYPELEPETGCWNWSGTKDKDGYGRFYFGKKRYYRPYRLTWSWANEQEFPNTQLPDHLCRNPSCVNPEHIEPVSYRENVVRGKTVIAANLAKTHCPQGHPYSEENTYKWKGNSRQCRECMREGCRRWSAKKRRARGVKIGSKRADTKFTERQVTRIKERIMRGDSKTKIAKDYKVSPGAIYKIAQNETWKYVPWPNE